MTPTNFKTYYKATVMNTLLYCCKNRYGSVEQNR